MSDTNLNMQTKTAWHFVVWTSQLVLSLAIPQHLYAIYGIGFISCLSVDHGKDHKTILQVKMEPQVLLGFVPLPSMRTALCGIPQGHISYGSSTPRTVTTLSINKHFCCSTLGREAACPHCESITQYLQCYFSQIMSQTEQTTGLQGSITKWNTTTRK